jgi:hypothetical protein
MNHDFEMPLNYSLRFEQNLKEYKSLNEFITSMENSMMSIGSLIESIRVVCGGFKTDERIYVIIRNLKEGKVIDFEGNVEDVDRNQSVLIYPSTSLKRLVKLDEIFGDGLK